MSRRRFVGASAAACALGALSSFVGSKCATLAVLADATVDLRRGREWTLGRLHQAVAHLRRLPAAPDALLFLGGLSANGDRREIELGADALAACGCAVHAVPGPIDRAVDGGAAWRERFGDAPAAFELAGTRILLLDSAQLVPGPGAVAPRRSRLRIDTALESYRVGWFELAEAQIAWLAAELETTPATAPVIAASHVPLSPLYRPWNWGVGKGGERALGLLDRHPSVTLLFGQVRSRLRTAWGAGRVAYSVPAVGSPQPPPRALCRALGLPLERAHTARGLAFARLAESAEPMLRFVALA
ncbi:MAG TPA: twin-arginine translocation signal domain-containing protein [Planctomycetota bacterium]|nr:twin-arginine translocation signal domain-containing protein [Planctomycetota bacterium]